MVGYLSVYIKLAVQNKSWGAILMVAIKLMIIGDSWPLQYRLWCGARLSYGDDQAYYHW